MTAVYAAKMDPGPSTSKQDEIIFKNVVYDKNNKLIEGDGNNVLCEVISNGTYLYYCTL